MKRLLDLVGRKSEVARYLDRAWCTTGIDKMLINPQPKRGVGGQTLPGFHDRFSRNKAFASAAASLALMRSSLIACIEVTRTSVGAQGFVLRKF
jgi:hypothetical protein